MGSFPRAKAAAAVAALVGLTGACSGDDGAGVRDDTSESIGTGAASATGADVAAPCRPVGIANESDHRVLGRVSEWYVRLADPSAPAGKINFHIENAGKEAHEVVVVRGSDPAALPTGQDGSVETGKLPPGVFVGEVEPFSPGVNCDGTFDLSPGRYVLLCNVVEKKDDGTIESHYQEGMRAAFLVE